MDSLTQAFNMTPFETAGGTLPGPSPASFMNLPMLLGGTGGGSGTSGGSWLSTILPYLGLGMGGSSMIGNMLANNARNSVLNAEMQRMNTYNKMTPAQVTAGITSLEQPLSSNLIHSVGNTVQGQLAERGLSQAPGIQTEALAQGLAPYQLQEQQLAQQAFFQKLGLPISAQPSPFGPYPQTSNTSQLWQMLMSKFKGNPNDNYASPGQIANLGASLGWNPSFNPMSMDLPSPSVDFTSLPSLLSNFGFSGSEGVEG